MNTQARALYAVILTLPLKFHSKYIKDLEIFLGRAMQSSAVDNSYVLCRKDYACYSLTPNLSDFVMSFVDLIILLDLLSAKKTDYFSRFTSLIWSDQPATHLLLPLFILMQKFCDIN